MSKIQSAVLPRLLLAAAVYKFVEVPLGIRLYLTMPQGWGATGISPEFGAASLAASVAETASLGALCLILAFVSRAYYARDEKLETWMGRFAFAANTYCLFYALNSLPTAYLTARQFLDAGSLISSMAGAFTMLGFVPVVAMILIMKDLLAECLVLREEAAHTV